MNETEKEVSEEDQAAKDGSEDDKDTPLENEPSKHMEIEGPTWDESNMKETEHNTRLAGKKPNAICLTENKKT